MIPIQPKFFLDISQYVLESMIFVPEPLVLGEQGESANGNTETNTETNTAGMNTFELMLVSIHRGLVYLNFKFQGLVVEVKQVAFFIFHRQGDTIHIIVTTVCIAQNMWLWCLVVNLFKGLTANIESRQAC